ncbi:MAG: hypothetical protein KIT84_14580 [Labilithrix sp.]|nr:hypothetical protein [Labilithrix sp.]MCW5812248.1 hypothetical protein [Labilithrix sp.]
MRHIILALSTVLVGSFVACGGDSSTQPPPVTPTPPQVEADASAPGFTAPDQPGADAGGAAAQPGADKPKVEETNAPKFDDLPKDKKVEVMMTKVVPNVGKVFKEHDAKRYEKFGCATCHGPSKKQDPRDVLPKLTMSNGGHEKLMKAKPAIMKFMGEKVVPEMASALGEKPFDPATKQGFGCAGCHKID